jgi:hypothetical protein
MKDVVYWMAVPSFHTSRAHVLHVAPGEDVKQEQQSEGASLLLVV